MEFCLLVILATVVKDASGHANDMFIEKTEAISFLSRQKRSLVHECDEGCSFEEVDELFENHSKNRLWMVWYKCRRVTCPSGTLCSKTNNDFSHIHRLRVHCEDNNECITSNHDCNHICTNTYGSYECSCYHGYQFQHDNKTCLDINECESSADDCDQTCINLNGSYECSCYDGYLLHIDNKTCTDYNRDRYRCIGKMIKLYWIIPLQLGLQYSSTDTILYTKKTSFSDDLVETEVLFV
ncbi:growth arrest-specific protein 6-like [Mytilus californianus]|uniref:growth arrest-specific protein 6-like n=1 Tax=Mytilus californianus TaxID=6549 RepID=UPI0022455036|nr:growth arrest-specific protein 6-like [Mytilus californianus]XP_052068953.1 growth arrest-specific protein 6-like [Mytilus californianus]